MGQSQQNQQNHQQLFQILNVKPLQTNLFCPTKKAYQKLLQILKEYHPETKQQLIIPSNFQKGNTNQKFQFILILPYNVIYQGQWKLNKPHGKGNLYFQDGSIFRGFFKQGIPYGEDNLFIFKDGSYYRGQIQNNSFNGQGQFCSQQVKYIGRWKNGLPHGKGYQIFENKNQYEGNYIQGYKQGINQVFKWNNHESIFHKYQGGFKKGWFEGNFLLTLYDGHTIKGTYKDQLVQNIAFQCQNYIFQGSLDRQLLNGKGKLSNNNTFYEGSIKNGKIHGNGSFKLQNDKHKEVYWFQGIMLEQMKGTHKDSQIQQILLNIRKFFSLYKKYSLTLENLSKNFRLYTFSYEKINQSMFQNFFIVKVGKRKLNCIRIK